MNLEQHLADRRWFPILIAGLIGGGLGWLIESTVAWITIGAVVGLGTAAMIVVFGVRPLVAAPVGTGAGIGAYLGGTIVGVLCDPAGCPAFEAAAASATGIGALVGIGLVMALATRSFDEYREATRRGATPPTSSYNVEESPTDGSD